MKSIFLSLFLFIGASIPNTVIHSDVELFKVQITDQSGNPLAGASVIISYDENLIFRGTTDIYGLISVEIEKEEIDIKVSLPGYHLEEIRSVKTTDRSITITLRKESVMEEIFTLTDSRPKEKKSYDSESMIPASMSISSSAIRSSGSGLSGYAPEKKLPGSGQVTAGEWNDLHNWKEWKNLISSEEYRSMTDAWNMHTNNRYSVLVLNDKDIPLPGAVVKLLDKKGTLIWQAHSDVSGKAELYQGSFGESKEAHQVIIEYEGESETIRQINHSDRGAMIARFKVPCPEPLKVDISWIVDATSSMSDEIEYLQ